MSLKYALLGFLSTEPASGYTLAQEFGESMGWFWSASHSQIYPELHRLEEQGLILSQEAPGEGAKIKKIYRISDAGRLDLQRWVVQEHEYPPIRDAERIKLVFLDDAPLDAVRRHLQAHLKHHEDLLAIYRDHLGQIRAGTFPRLLKRQASRPAAAGPTIAALKALAMQGNVARARTEIAWAQDALALIEGLPDPHVPSVEHRSVEGGEQ